MRHRRRRLARQRRRWGTSLGRRLWPWHEVRRALYEMWEAGKRGETGAMTFGLVRDVGATRLGAIRFTGEVILG